MPRLNVVEPSEATGKAKELFEGPLKSMQLNIFKGMANSPAVLNAYVQLTGALSDTVSLGAKERELVQIAVSELNGCNYCQGAHTMLGKNAGLSEHQTIAARKGETTGDAKLDGLVRFARTLHEKRGFVSDSDLDEFRSAGWDDAAVAEVVAVYAAITFTNFFNHVNETDVDVPAAPALAGV